MTKGAFENPLVILYLGHYQTAMRKTFILAFTLLFLTSIPVFAQTWEVFDLKGTLQQRAIFDRIEILGETVITGKNESGLFLLSPDLRPMLDLQGDEVYQYLQPWIVVKGPKGLGAFHEYGQLALPLEYEEIKTYPNLLLARKGREYWMFERGKNKITALGSAEEAKLTHHGMIILKKGEKFYLPLSSQPDRGYDYLEENEGNFLLAKESTGFGLINREGIFVLEPVIDQLEHTRGNFFYGFDENQYLLIQGDEIRAQVSYNSYHRITKEGNLMLEYIHGKLRRIIEEDGILLDAVGMESVTLIGNDLYNVRFRDNKLGLLGKKGWLVQPISDAEWIGAGSEGLFPAKKNGKTGFLSEAGTWAIQPQFEEVGNFSEKIASFRKGNSWGLINADGRIVNDPKWKELKKFENGTAIAKSEDTSYYLLNSSGNVINPTGFEKICRLKEGFLLVESQGKKGILDSNGHILLSLEYDQVEVVSKDLIIVHKNGLAGIINTAGNTLFPIQYQQIQLDWADQKVLAKEMYIPVVIPVEEPGTKRKKGAKSSL
ncbi:WG repeat-containing protein [Algoriphagus aquatilis]|uniref:WG repeat-containing protein n=1 Tax=Algoriphagus aquatilis TaxID=490186 RepID=A0ABW0BYN9_9BACT